MTQDCEREHDAWQAALDATLGDAMEHLQVLIFEEGWDALREETGSDEAALRESVARYERELARLFGFFRSLGALPDAVSWSALKTRYRRDALDAGTEISLRTALESGFYAAEPVPLGDHGRYLRWAAALQGFLTDFASDRSSQPGSGATADERLEWAYEVLSPIEDHDRFHAAFAGWLGSSSAERAAVGEIVAFQERLMGLPRFDLVLNTSLRWLAETTDD